MKIRTKLGSSSEKENSDVFKMISKEKSQFIFRMLENIYSSKTSSRKTKMETINSCIHHITVLEKKVLEIYGSSFIGLKELAKFE